MEDHKLSLYDNIAKVNAVDPELYERYPVKRGLRNGDGSGVIAGVTNISNVHGYLMNEGDKVPDEGKLTFRGYSIYDLVGGDATKRRGFEEIVYLLLMGELPTSSQLDVLVEALDAQRNLPDGFSVRCSCCMLTTQRRKSVPSNTRSVRQSLLFLVCRASWCWLTMPSVLRSTMSR